MTCDTSKVIQTNRVTKSIKAKYDKINFVYRNPSSISSPYMYFRGLKTALERNGLLHYTYDVTGTEPLDMNELLKFPILFIRGSWEPIFNVVKLVSGKQFTATINTESLFPKKGSYPGQDRLKISKLFRKRSYSKIFELLRQKNSSEMLNLFKRNIFRAKGSREKDYFTVLKNRSKYFDLYFSPVEEDLEKYFGKPCYWFPSWVHTELLDDVAPPVSDKIGFIGTLGGQRRKFFKQNKKGIIECLRTLPKDDALENVKELCKLVNKYKYLINPGGYAVRCMTGKTFEYMACKRLCFCYLDEEYMFKSRLLFEDKKEIVYFKTFAELEEKYRYYLKNSEKADQIAQTGYEKVRKYHNADVRAKRFVNLVLHHANGGEYNESFNEISTFGGKPCRSMNL